MAILITILDYRKQNDIWSLQPEDSILYLFRSLLDFGIKKVHWPLGPHNYNTKKVEAYIVNMCKYFKITGGMHGVCRYQ